MKLYGHEISTPFHKVRFVLHLLGQDYEYKRVNLREGEQHQPAFLKLNPLGKVPVLTDGEVVLFESNTIARYLALKHQSELYPAELHAQSLVNQWMDFTSLHINSAMGRVFYNRVIAPQVSAPVDEQSIQDGLNFLERYLPILDSELSKRDFLASHQLSLADLNLLAALEPAEAVNIDLEPYDALMKWRLDLQGREFRQKCYGSYLEVLASLQ